MGFMSLQALQTLLEGPHNLAALHCLASIATGLRNGFAQAPPAAVATLISSTAPDAIFGRLASLTEVGHGMRAWHCGQQHCMLHQVRCGAGDEPSAQLHRMQLCSIWHAAEAGAHLHTASCSCIRL